MSWKPIDVSLGSLPAKDSATQIYSLDGKVPDTANEILVYLSIRTGADNSDEDRTFKIKSQVERKKDVYIYFFAHGYGQDAWSYNSDNIWLPMPFDNELVVERTGNDFCGGVYSEIKIIGYK